jgi:hypothetical protein
LGSGVLAGVGSLENALALAVNAKPITTDINRFVLIN